MLEDMLEKNFRINEGQKTALKKLGLKTVRDLLYYFPVRYGDTAEIKPVSTLTDGQMAVVFGKITKLKAKKSFRSRINMTTATLTDENGSTLSLVWFNQPYISKMIPEGAFVRVEGKATLKNENFSIANPKVETVGSLPTGVGSSLFTEGSVDDTLRLYPIYPETRGVTSNWIYHAIQKIFADSRWSSIEDPIPPEIREKYHLPSIQTAFVWMHAPRKMDDAESAKKRFSFEEVFLIQIEKQTARKEWHSQKSFKVEPDTKSIQNFINRFPFPLTSAQNRAIEHTFSDFKSGRPMSRLLEGDVGSGKTAVAATTAYAIATTHPNGQSFGNLQVAYMCPTEILATQHFESFITYFRERNMSVGLITGSGCRKFPSKVNPEGWTSISRAQLLKWVANGEIPILIGTHALIQKSVKFKHLAYVIIDEQHRFGTAQRQALVRRQTQNSTQTNADNKTSTSDDLLYKDLTYKIRRIIFEVRKELGLGHKEKIYQLALTEAFTKNGLDFSKEEQIPIMYQKKKVGVYIPDFVIDKKVIVELKSLPFVGSQEKKQVWQYLKGSQYRLALLVNFGHTEATIDRIVYDKRRDGLSASVPHESASSPHLLSMTATPIPRTLALTIYGDLDLTLLDETPPGRKPIITEAISPNMRNDTYERVRTEIQKGRQVYIICPRIDEPDPTKEMAVQARATKSEATRLQRDVFPEYTIGVLHSKMKPKEKDMVMSEFVAGKIHILVATSVVEVGVNVPNATTIIIEGAERFGLAQLHQLRGRVQRSSHQAYCFIFTETLGEKTRLRLKALITAPNGFVLAEEDLKLRGAGELSGGSQWGMSDIAMEALKNIKMVEASRLEASRCIEDPKIFDEYPPLARALLQKKNKPIHFE